MQSVLGEIAKLRPGIPVDIDCHNSNRYRLVVREKDGSRTAYYFSMPIYNIKTRKIVDVRFHLNGQSICATGSNTDIILNDYIFMENTEGVFSMRLHEKPVMFSPNEVQYGFNRVYPTTNGVAVKCDVKKNESNSFIIETGKSHLNIRANDRCFALMQEEFRPFVVVSCMGSTDETGNVISPAKLDYQKIDDKKYSISLYSTNSLAQYVLFEVNMYEKKIFQDTTVESANPFTNNAFGGVGFIGNSSEYGEQWLYSRIDFSRIPEVFDRCVNRVVLQIPKLNQNNVEISGFKVLARFCSFGSNWNNKIADGDCTAQSITSNFYHSMDITSLLRDIRTKTIVPSEGLILKSKIKGSGFSVIATGDSYYTPQILEINYR